ncbi:ComEC/Rec2 family competence protein [Polymorphospora rubra]|uniref:ComEC/Rec2 family competence protein n=1 Tax=Polymorphospora rubra TaxID=338584 RepID=UPI00340DCA3C
MKTRDGDGLPGADDRPADPPDLRLAGFAVATWLSALGALHWPVAVTGAVAAGAVLALLALLFSRSTAGPLTSGPRAAGAPAPVDRAPEARPAARRLPWTPRPDHRLWIVVSVLLGLLCGSAAAGARVAVRDAGPVTDLVAGRASVTVELVVRDDPRPIAGSAGRPPLYLVRAQTTWIRPDEGGRIDARLRLLVLATDAGWRPLLPGQRLIATGRLAQPRGGDLHAAVLNTGTAPVLVGEPSWAQRAAGSLRAGLQLACAPLPDEPGGLLPGLVVGDTSRLDPAVEEDFRATGMTHLVAVSGSNVAIVIGLVLLLARWARAGPWLAAAACALALVGFVILARPSPSVVRAGTMGAIALIGLATGRPRAALPALGAAVTVLVVYDPGLAGDAGFALSVLATGGLLLLAPGWRDALRRRGTPTWLADALAVPAAAQLACGPVVAGLSGTVSLVAVPANLLAVPAIAPATVLGVAAAVVSPLWPAGAEFAAWLGGWPAWWLVVVARYGARAPAGTLPWLDGVAGGLSLGLLTLVVVRLARRPAVRRLLAVGVAAVVVGALPVRLAAPGWPPSGWVVAACAVGQGDTVVLPIAAGRAVVVDAGPDPAAADRCLRRLGIREVSLLVISHFHADHVAGLDGVLRGRRLGAVVTTAWPEPAAGRDAVERAAATRGVVPGQVAAGWRFVAGQVELTVVGPPEGMSGTRSDPNNNSLVLRARVGGTTMLFTGDAEEEEQRALLERYGPAGVRAELLKVPHHGSVYQDAAFLAAVDPAVALVSVGVDNDYGHPNPALLAMLTRGGARVLRTDVDGDLAVVVGERGLAVVVRGPDHQAR